MSEKKGRKQSRHVPPDESTSRGSGRKRQLQDDENSNSEKKRKVGECVAVEDFAWRSTDSRRKDEEAQTENVRNVSKKRKIGLHSPEVSPEVGYGSQPQTPLAGEPVPIPTEDDTEGQSSCSRQDSSNDESKALPERAEPLKSAPNLASLNIATSPVEDEEIFATWKALSGPLLILLKSESKRKKILGRFYEILIKNQTFENAYVPENVSIESAERIQQYEGFTTWFLGQLLYLLTLKEVKHLENKGVHFQAVILEEVWKHSPPMFFMLLMEYLNTFSFVAEHHQSKKLVVLPTFIKGTFPLRQETSKVLRYLIVLDSDKCTLLIICILKLFRRLIRRLSFCNAAVCYKFFTHVCSLFHTEVKPSIKLFALKVLTQLSLRNGFPDDIQLRELFISSFVLVYEECIDKTDVKKRIFKLTLHFFDLMKKKNVFGEDEDTMLFNFVYRIVNERCQEAGDKLKDGLLQQACRVIIQLLARNRKLHVEKELLDQIICVNCMFPLGNEFLEESIVQELVKYTLEEANLLNESMKEEEKKKGEEQQQQQQQTVVDVQAASLSWAKLFHVLQKSLHKMLSINCSRQDLLHALCRIQTVTKISCTVASKIIDTSMLPKHVDFRLFHSGIYGVIVPLVKVLQREKDLKNMPEVYLCILEVFGAITLLPEFKHEKQEHRFLTIFFSLPWLHSSEKCWEEHSALFPYLFKIPHYVHCISRTTVRRHCIQHLTLIPPEVLLDWRYDILRRSIRDSDTQIVTACVDAIPYYICYTGRVEDVVTEVILPGLENKDPSVQYSFSQVIPLVVCILSRNCVPKRQMMLKKADRLSVCFDCLVCDLKKHNNTRGQILHLNLLHKLMPPYLELLNSPSVDVRLTMIKSVSRLNSHVPDFKRLCQAESWLQFIEDEDLKVRQSFADEVNNLIFAIPLLTGLKLPDECTGYSLTPEQTVHLNYCGSVVCHCLKLLLSAAVKTLVTHNKESQETILLTVRNIGRIPLEYILLPCLVVVILYVGHARSLVQSGAISVMKMVAQAHNTRPLTLYHRHKLQICKIIAELAVRNHHCYRIDVTQTLGYLGNAFYGDGLHSLINDVKHFIPFLIPALVKRNVTSDAVLQHLAMLLGTTAEDLLQTNFRSLCTHLYLHEKPQMTELCLQYFDKNAATPLASHNIDFELKQNQLLFHAHTHMEKVINALAIFAAVGSVKTPDQISLPDIAAYLQPRFLGFLIEFEHVMNTPAYAECEKKKAFLSLIHIIKLMGPKHISPFKRKLLASLRSAFQFKRSNFPDITLVAWEAFVHNLESTSLSMLIVSISASLVKMMDDFPCEVNRLFAHLIRDYRNSIRLFFPDIYFLRYYRLDLRLWRHIVNRIFPYPLQCALSLALSFMRHDTVDVRVHAVRFVKDIAARKQYRLKAVIEHNRIFDTTFTEIVDILMTGCSDPDPDMRVACISCLGEIGAIDLSLLPRHANTYDRQSFPLDIRDSQFPYVAVNILAQAFVTARHSTHLDSFALGIQEILKAFDITPRNSKWNIFSVDVREIITPFVDSKYRGSDTKKCVSRSIFGSRRAITFPEWLYNLASAYVDTLKDEAGREMFASCLFAIKNDATTAMFFLPQILLHSLFYNSRTVNTLKAELIAPLVSTVQAERNLIPYRLHNFEKFTLQYGTEAVKSKQCKKTIYNTLDYMERWLREWKAAVCRDHNVIAEETECYVNVEGVVSAIPKDTLAFGNYQVAQYARALLNIELHIRSHPEEFQKHLGFISRCFAQLAESDAVSGCMKLQQRELTQEELILTYEINEHIQEAAACYEQIHEKRYLSPYFVKRSLKCYMTLNQPQTAKILADSIISDRPDLEPLVYEQQSEVFCRLSMWDQLTHLIKKPDVHNSKQWGTQLSKAFMYLMNDKRQDLENTIFEMRSQLLESLNVANVAEGTYHRCREEIVRSHIISEFMRVKKCYFHILDQTHPPGRPRRKDGVYLFSLFDSLNTRMKLAELTPHVIQPILEFRRSVLEIGKILLHERSPSLVSFFNHEIGKLWLRSAASARKMGHFQQAYNYIVKAEQYKLKDSFVEKAKILWCKNDQKEAFKTLSLGLNKHFPATVSFCSRCPQGLLDRQLCSKAKLLVAQYNEETVNADVDENAGYYKEAVAVCRTREKAYVRLAQYYDRVFFDTPGVTEQGLDKGDLQMSIINYFGTSLECGCNYIYQSLPRMINIWISYGSRYNESMNGPFKPDNFRSMKIALGKMTKIIDSFLDKLPHYMFFTVLSQVLSRLCHPEPEVCKQLKRIVVKLLLAFPQQTMWMLVPVCKSTHSVLTKKAEEIFADPLLRGFSQKYRNDFTRLVDLLIEFTNKPIKDVSSRNTSCVSGILRSLPRFFRSSTLSNIAIPVQRFISPRMPMKSECFQTHNAFSSMMVYIRDIDEEFVVLASLQKPRRISFKGTDGQHYKILCKPKDDLRQDFRLMEFNTVINKYLSKHREARMRHLSIRTYAVVPLTDSCGLIEWLPNLLSFRSILTDFYKEKKIYTTGQSLRSLMCSSDAPLAEKLRVFKTKLLPRHPSVFREWFLLNFPDANSWYRARLAYIRTTAVMSMVGFIVGLGDRHGENILLDSKTGEAVHVDFNCLFNKGESLEVPERVPFRLTHNMVDAMGPVGIEGSFRQCALTTLRTIRMERRTLMAFLRPFVYDPVPTWPEVDYDPKSRKNVELFNKKAITNLEHIERRISGVVKCSKDSYGLQLSVEGQVNSLIREAVDEVNLCQMYLGWGPFL